jgi:multidrug transporter EmrE-like cation transporter
VALASVWATVAMAVAPLRAGKRVPLALAAALWPGLGTANPDAHLPDGFVGQRLAFTVAELVPLGLVLLAAFLLARTRRPPAR